MPLWTGTVVIACFPLHGNNAAYVRHYTAPLERTTVILRGIGQGQNVQQGKYGTRSGNLGNYFLKIQCISMLFA
ncbi:hypothetical protein BGC30_13835 [Novacetimonas hansenii]|nr:hypothetical protein BGC30_13835 [Novacetimonas hansenii]